jgi:NADH-quinone oxidoreductase subunit G
VALETTPDLAADCASLLRAANREARLLYSLPGANAFGAALLSSSSGPFSDVLVGMEKGAVKGLIVIEADPFKGFPDRRRLTESLENLDLLIVLDYLPTLSAEKADILIPTATLFETDSFWINHEARLQKASAQHRGGIPIRRVSGGGHPPRTFESSIPGGEPRPAAAVLAGLGAGLSFHESASCADDIRSWLIEEYPMLTALLSLGPEDPGARLLQETGTRGRFSVQGKEPAPAVPEQEAGFDVHLVEWSFGTEELSGFSPYARRAEKEPQLVMHQQDAFQLGLSGGDTVTLHLPGGALKVALVTAANMARGVIVLPRHRLLDWQKVQTFNFRLAAGKIERS